MWYLKLMIIYFAILQSRTVAESNATRYAILNNDWGSTSFIPILMGLDAGIEILGVASSTCDTWQKQAAYHALAVLEIGNLSCIPVVYGATYPLVNTISRLQTWEAFSGPLVFQGVFAPYNATAEALGADPTSGSDPNRIEKAAFVEGFPNTTALQGQVAAQFMVEQVRKYPGQVSIYAAGGLTNVALAVRLDDEFASLAKELVIMGGYVDVNILQATGSLAQSAIYSDINLKVDPEAAKIALTADFPEIVVVGNVASTVLTSQEFLDELYEVKNPYTELLHEYFGTTYAFWDETAMGLLVDPTLATSTSTVYVDVDLSYSSPTWGNLHVYQQVLAPPNLRNVTYVNAIDVERFMSMMKHAVQYPQNCGTL
ncbi:inosine-uridine preferring nucleoside hydrolase [Mollisia scopiformis]|uniref:Inosine-uridine preferring nucleoside hydrolase n=1 Tax=Mollisia scopiformis TaxID=149040 RepID=A0A194X391_MOLSC|nr:inosine-uridine preferring nucleoside hydrolase [Mollisia scopiformis]KUJ14292.1 inosine-uridine preferring nucleoside hydrolase [Mollisia scopiformis]